MFDILRTWNLKECRVGLRRSVWNCAKEKKWRCILPSHKKPDWSWHAFQPSILETAPMSWERYAVQPLYGVRTRPLIFTAILPFTGDQTGRIVRTLSVIPEQAICPRTRVNWVSLAFYGFLRWVKNSRGASPWPGSVFWFTASRSYLGFSTLLISEAGKIIQFLATKI